MKSLGKKYVQSVRNLNWFNLGVFDCAMMQKQYIFSRNRTMNFDFFPG